MLDLSLYKVIRNQLKKIYLDLSVRPTVVIPALRTVK